MNTREQIVTHLEQTLQNMQNPQPVLVTRELFDVEKLAITQYPAVMINFDTETRENLTMGPNAKKLATMTVKVRGFLRGKNLDTQRNQFIATAETALEQDRKRELGAIGVKDTTVTEIEVVERQQPLAEVVLTVEVNYVYTQGQP